MDAFKAAEIERMRLGGNKPWRDFFEGAESNKMAGIRYVCYFLALGGERGVGSRLNVGWIGIGVIGRCLG
jgi:ADP-ribosylation factor GTPase-activating protein 1